jgi:hypothetical protein
MRCDHKWVKRFVHLMYSCTDLKIYIFCISVNYNAGCRILNIIITRLRHRSSSLNVDLFGVNVAMICGYAFEDAM